MTDELKPIPPPDLQQCQAEFREGSFMTLGPRSMRRCPNPPKYIMTEAVPGKDGRIGSMSVCNACAIVASKKFRKAVKFREIGQCS